MSLELPGWVIDAFNFLGLPWPAIDEDELRGWARDLREFATDLTQLSQLSHDAVHGLKDSNRSGVVKTLAEHWDHHHSQLMAMHGPMNAFAEALDIAAEAVVVQKGVVIGAAVALAAEVIATQGEALFTLGIAEAELPLEIALTKTTVKFALQELENKIVGYLINQAAAEVTRHANATISKMLKGSTSVVFEAVSLKVDYQALQHVADTAKKHKNRVETASIRAHRQANARKIETRSAGGRWHVVQVLEAALKSIAEDVFKRLPGTLHRVLDETEKDLEKSIARIKRADTEKGSEAGKNHDAGAPPHSLSDSGRPPASNAALSQGAKPLDHAGAPHEEEAPSKANDGPTKGRTSPTQQDYPRVNHQLALPAGPPTTRTLKQIRNMKANTREKVRKKSKAGEQFAREVYRGGPERHFHVPINSDDPDFPVTTPKGRKVDCPVYLPDGTILAIEIKTYNLWRTETRADGTKVTVRNEVSLAKVREQINKDVWLMRNEPGYMPLWEFQGAGPSKELRDYLNKAGIGMNIYSPD
ncbi:hypothetical protein [Streptomyces misionensis]